jgi:CxxC-x17-CxxC domain-containing protein
MNYENKGGSSSGGFRPMGPRNMHMGPREMHKATCADCKQETEVPFKPSGDRPVYCRECYQSHRPKR